MILVYDTETSGFTKENLPPDHPSQPHLVQLAARLMDVDGKVYHKMNMIVKPDGWTIPEGASKVHGITTELATRVGLSLRVVVACFLQMRYLSTLSVAHNESFDWLVVEAQIARLKVTPSVPWPERTCTMRKSTELVGLPPTPKMARAGYTKNKPPNLNELHTFLFGKGFDGAHDADVDMNACADCFLELRKRGVM